MQLQNKTVLISGAARGIGKASAIELAKAGAKIVGVDLCVEDLKDTENAVLECGSTFSGFACDISDSGATMKLLKEIELKNIDLDVLLNNAGVLPSGAFVDRDFTVWQKTIAINLVGLMRLTHALLPKFIEKGSGHIVNIASVAGKFGSEGVAAYGASKHGVVGFSSALREELQEYNIGVSWICPSTANTRMTEGVSRTFLTPLVQPEDVAKAVRKAIEKNMIEVFVPNWVRFHVSILPSLAPRFSRWLSKSMKASQGWVQAKKEISV